MASSPSSAGGYPNQQPRMVTINAKGPGDKERLFRIKGNVHFKKLVEKYFSEVSVDRSSVDILYNGHRLAVHRTPDQLGMRDTETITVVMLSGGGGVCVHYH